MGDRLPTPGSRRYGRWLFWAAICGTTIGVIGILFALGGPPKEVAFAEKIHVGMPLSELTRVLPNEVMRRLRASGPDPRDFHCEMGDDPDQPEWFFSIRLSGEDKVLEWRLIKVERSWYHRAWGALQRRFRSLPSLPF